MSRLSRSRLRRRKKWIAASIAGVICVIILLIFYYRWVQDDLWEDRKRVIQQVTSSVAFEEVLKAERYHDDETLWVITGKIENGEEQMAWWDDEQDELLFVTSLEDGISRQDAEDHVLSSQPDAKIIRVLPARHQGKWAWEVFYKYLEDPDKTRYAYDYYTFEEGEHLGTLKLAPELDR